MSRGRGLVIGLTLLSLAAWPARAAEGTAYQVRLLVLDGAARLTVQARGLKIIDGDLRDHLLNAGDAPVRIEAQGDGLVIPGVAHRPRSLILRAAGPVGIAERQLVGEVELSLRQGRLLVINRIALERYLAGLLGAEMSDSWPLEALKAQAVAARSYFLHRRLGRENQDYDLATSTLDQVYRGIGREGQRTRSAVAETAGLVLVYGHAPAETLFHACCGGRTRASHEVFGGARPYLLAVDDPDCGACPKHRWRKSISLSELGSRLAGKGMSGGVLKVRQQGERIEIEGRKGWSKTFRPQEFRRLLGTVVIPSDRFQLEQKGDFLMLQGQGSGHGVGMCQWGARGMAERGLDFQAILRRYYPACQLRRLY